MRRSSRWGLGLEIVGFAFIWAHVRPVGFDKSEAVLNRLHHSRHLPRLHLSGRRLAISGNSGATKLRSVKITN